MKSGADNFYQNKSEIYSVELKAVTRQLHWLAWYRFFAFVLILLPLFVFGLKSFLTLFISVTSIIAFFYLVRKNIQLDNKKKKLAVLKNDYLVFSLKRLSLW